MIQQKHNLAGRWSVKDSVGPLECARRALERPCAAHGFRRAMPLPGPASDIVWQRETSGKATLPWDDPDFAMFTGRRGFGIVAGFMLYRAGEVVGGTNVVCETNDAAAVWPSLALLATQTFPRLPLVGYESGRELEAAEAAGFERGDRLRVWVTDRD
ncbi:MAG: hypothetical protein IBJ11_10260 [Phycisphaerales bacterium]|nr:hypothetical protein [Phycisphaerales bacterium]